jgi:adenylate cyclase
MPPEDSARGDSELAEALAILAATREVLGIIGRSCDDAQPVFDLIAESAARLCKAQFCHVYRFDGTLIHFVAAHGLHTEALEAIQRAYPMPPGRGSAAARAIVGGTLAQIPDIAADPDYTHGAAARTINFRSVAAVPMLKDGKPIGAIAVARTPTGLFPEHQIELLCTFADQAVIAIENARMFNEIQDKNREVERQAAELAQWNATLETRVAEQVAQLGRMSKLTRFLSPKVSELIMSGHADDPLKTRRVEITVVYVDLRGFTAFTETADPEEVMGVLRQYHVELGREIMAYDGTIEHFAGDGVMIIFNDPVPVENHELQAIRMTLAVRDAMKGLAATWKKKGYALGFGAGIAGGYATVGTIGFEERLDYGAIGTVCNLAARLCGEATDGQILIAPRIFAKVEEQVEAQSVGELTLKGFARPVHAHNVLAAR